MRKKTLSRRIPQDSGEQISSQKNRNLDEAKLAEMKKQAETMAALGFTQDEAASVLGTSREFITNRFAKEFSEAKLKADAAVMQNLYKIATGDTAQAASAAMFWTKVRRRWHEVQRIIHGFDPEVLTQFVKQFSAVLKKTIPDTCPHCHTNLALRPKLAEELKAMSARLVDSLPPSEIVPIPAEVKG
jgi:hypothetical protein